MFKRNSHFKIVSVFLLFGLALLTMFALAKPQGTKIKAEGETAKIALRAGSKLSTYTGYKRYEGIIFNANGATEDLTFTSSATTAFVFKVKAHNAVKVAYAFYLNGVLNTGSSTTPTSTALYNNGTFVKNISHGSYSLGYYDNTSDFNYIVVPTTNFAAGAVDSSVTVSNMAIAIRLQGVASSNIEYSKANLDLFGIYLASDFTSGETLNIAGLKTLYTPAADSLGELDTGNSGITSSCIVGEYRTKITPTLTSGGNGEITFTGDAYTNEENMQINIAPSEGYELDTLLINDINVTTDVADNKYVFKAGTSITAHATFKKQTFAVTTTALHATLEADKTTVAYGENVTFTWTPEANCTFGSFKINGEEVQVTGTSYTLENVKAAVSAELTYKGNYTPTIQESEHGAVTFAQATYSDGDTISFTIAPDEGYELATLMVNGEDKAADVVDLVYTLENAPTSVTIAATFKVIELTITIDESQNGAVTSANAKFNYGTDVTFTIAPATGFALAEFKVNGVAQNVDAYATSYTVSNAKENLTITAKFLRKATVIAENGKVLADMYSEGDDVLVTLKPNAGYEFKSLKVNDAAVTLNQFGQYLVKNAPASLKLEAEFAKLDTYYVEAGSLTSIYNQFGGTVYAEFDAINVQTIKSVAGISAYKWVGITVDNLNKTVKSTDYLAIQLQNLDAGWRTFHIEVNGARFAGTYYLVDRLGHIATKTSTIDQGAITERYTYFSNATWNPGSSTSTEGFTGYVIIPIANFGDVTAITSISVYSGVKDKSNARFNIGVFAVLESFDPRIASDITSNDEIYHPAANNYKAYVDNGTDNTTEYCNVQFLAKDEFVLNALGPVAVEYNYDVLWIMFPQSMIGEDGYVDLAALGIKGIVFDVLNENDTQHFFTFRLAGSDNVSLSDTSKSMWQGAQSSATAFQRVIYDYGLVRTRASAFLAFDESGLFDGRVYIPLSSDGFTKIGGTDAEFPSKVQPVMRILLGSGKNNEVSEYKVKISNLRFVTDDAPYQNYLITLLGGNAVIDAKVGDKTVGRDTNNRVAPGTEIIIDVTANPGCVLNFVKATVGETTTTLTKAEDGKYHVIVNGDITINVDAEEAEYTITYNLDGGTNNALNRSVYYLSDNVLTLLPATKDGYRFLCWTDEEGAEVDEIDCSLMKNITLTAVFEKIGGDTPTTQAPTTQAPATQAPTTQAPATQAPATQTPSETGKKKGCKSFVESLPIFALLLIPAATVVIKRRKEN